MKPLMEKLSFLLLIFLFCLPGCLGGPPPTPDYKTSIYWSQKNAKNGSVSAQKMLGNMYYLGDGVPKDLKKAYAWYKLAADQGDTTALKFTDIISTLLSENDLSDAKALARILLKQ